MVILGRKGRIGYKIRSIATIIHLYKISKILISASLFVALLCFSTVKFHENHFSNLLRAQSSHNTN